MVFCICADITFVLLPWLHFWWLLKSVTTNFLNPQVSTVLVIRERHCHVYLVPTSPTPKNMNAWYVVFRNHSATRIVSSHFSESFGTFKVISTGNNYGIIFFVSASILIQVYHHISNTGLSGRILLWPHRDKPLIRSIWLLSEGPILSP